MTNQITRRHALFTLPAFALPSVAAAQEVTGDPMTVEINAIALPVVSNGVLVNYLFGAVIIQVANASSAFFLREQSYLVRDAMIKIASRAPIPAGPTPRSFDRVAVTRVVLRAIQAIRPSIRVVRVTVDGAAFMR